VPHATGVVVRQGEALVAEAVEVLARALVAGVAARGRGSLALSGGRAPVPAYRALAARADVPWEKVDLYWVDERCVPPDHADSNYRLVREAVLDALGPARQPRVFRMEGERPDADAAARDYEARLPEALDAVVIGVGEDGHTASLFPGHPQLLERARRVVAVEDSPKPPPRRLTLTFPVLEAARTRVGIVTGEGKREAVAALRSGGALGGAAGAPVPAARVPGVLWLVDPAAAGE
jgi:6-phosphogluconolactonase